MATSKRQPAKKTAAKKTDAGKPKRTRKPKEPVSDLQEVSRPQTAAGEATVAVEDEPVEEVQEEQPSALPTPGKTSILTKLKSLTKTKAFWPIAITVLAFIIFFIGGKLKEYQVKKAKQEVIKATGERDAMLKSVKRLQWERDSLMMHTKAEDKEAEKKK